MKQAHRLPRNPCLPYPTALPSSRELLADLARLCRIQPATALRWAVEIREVLKAGVPEGDGLELRSGDGALTGMILKRLRGARVLRPAGALITTVPAPWFHDLLRAKGGQAGLRAYLDRMDARLAQYNYLTAGDWAARFARNGVRLDSTSPYLSGPQVRRWESLSAMTAGVLQRPGRAMRSSTGCNGWPGRTTAPPGGL